jgi:hypothetical protein
MFFSWGWEVRRWVLLGFVGGVDVDVDVMD